MSPLFTPHMAPKVRSERIMRAPKLIPQMPCTARLSGFIMQRCSPMDTRVMAHLPGVPGKGTSTKVTDLATICACHNCHRLLDQPSPSEREALHKFDAAVQNQLLRALVETHAYLLAAEIIVVPGGEIV